MKTQKGSELIKRANKCGSLIGIVAVYENLLKGKIVVDEAELREELKKWDKDVKANIMSAWAPEWIRKEILGE